jgi:predicted PurR-regulated permease PerM
MTDRGIQRVFFIVLLFSVTLGFIWLIRGFLQPIFWAAALAIVFHPVHAALAQRIRRYPSLAALATVLLVVLVVILPLLVVGGAVTTEATALYERLDAGDIDLGSMYQAIESRVPRLAESLQAIGIDPTQLRSQLSTSAVSVSQYIASRALAFGQNTVRVTLMFFVMLYLLFFFLRDGLMLLDNIVHALPLGDERERHLFTRFAEVSRATIKGTLVVGAAQGTIGGVAFAILGLGAPVLWGVVMTLSSILPAVGPALVWVPASIYLIGNGRLVAGIVLIAIGVLVIGLVDNLLRPILVGRDTRMPDYLILVSTLGGLAAFGLAGIVMGPIIAAFFLSVWAMAREEFAQRRTRSQ